MFMNTLNSPNYTNSELQAETQGVGGEGGENVEPEAGNFIDVASVYRVYHILGGKMHSELVSVTYITEHIHAENSFQGFICQLT